MLTDTAVPLTIPGPCALTAVDYLGHHLSSRGNAHMPLHVCVNAHIDTHNISFACMHERTHTGIHVQVEPHTRTHNKPQRSELLALALSPVYASGSYCTALFLFFFFFLFHSYTTSLSLSLSLSLSPSKPKLGIQSASHP